MTADPAPFPADPRGPAPTELLVVWAETREDAREFAWWMGLDMRQVFAVGNDSADSLRGVMPTAVLVLPGADSADVVAQLRTAAATGSGIPFLDLRRVQR